MIIMDKIYTGILGRQVVFAALTLLILAGCGWEPVPPPEAPPAERVLLMYDNIDNSNGLYFDQNVTAAGKAVANSALDPGERVVVFDRNFRMDSYGGARSVIYELVKDASQREGFRREVLKVYNQNENADLSTGVIAAVVGDIRRAVPAPRYGFAFGSHGMGWIPRSSSATVSRAGKAPVAVSQRPFAELWEERESPLTRYFRGYGKSLDVSEFIDGLDEWPWDFILLDDCFMASAETLYEMRTLADYFIASPTEIIIQGFPYDDVVSILFAGWERNLESSLTDVADAFVEAYRAGTMNPELPYATIAVVKASEMDALAESVGRLNLRVDEVTSTTGIQYYEGFSRPGHVFYDFDDYLSRVRGDAMPAEYQTFKAQLERTVIFKDHTGSFYSDFPQGFGGSVVPITHFSGLAIFIPWSQTAAWVSDYRQTEWYKAVYAQ